MTENSRKLPSDIERAVRRIVEARARRARALSLRRAGLTLQKIGDELGVTRQRALQMVIQAQREEGGL